MRIIGGASREMANQRLREMEGPGPVDRRVLSNRPIAVACEITDLGRSSLTVLEQLKNWAEASGIWCGDAAPVQCPLRPIRAQRAFDHKG